MSQRKGHSLTMQHPPVGLVLHAAWSPDGRLGLWGESATLAATTPAKPAKSHQGQPARHPFACRAEDLLALGSAALTAGKPGVLRLWLPSAQDGPRPSPGCAPTAGTSPPAETTLAAWQVPAIMLMPADAWPLLDWLRANPAGITAGPSLRYLNLIAKAILHLAVQGDLLPRLEAVSGGVQATWRPAPTAVTTLLARLSGHLPASLLAAHSPGNAQSPPPADLLARLVDALADAFARRSAKQALATVPSTAPAEYRAAAAWLMALAADESTVTASAKSLRSLAMSLGTWPEATPPAVPTEPLSLHLVPPSPQAPANTPWRLELVQTGTGPGSHQGGRPSMKVLWRAAKVYPPLNRAIEAQGPAVLALSPREALDFLHRGAHLLQAAGFAVSVPSWHSMPTGSLGLSLHTEPGTIKAGATNPRYRFAWQVTLGGERLSQRDVQRLAHASSPLVNLGGAWVEVPQAELERAAALIRATGPAGDVPLRELLDLTQGPGADDDTFSITTSGWLSQMQSLGDDTIEPVAPPAGLQATLRDYQRRGLAWLHFMSRNGLGACLADDMGLGKTIQTLALLLSERADDERPGPTLLVCPTSVVGNWQREVARFAPSLRVHVHHGPGRLAAEAFTAAAGKSDLVITTYGLAARDQALLAGVAWRRLVLDEAQMIKNAATKQHQAIVALPAAHRVALTGTPVENRLADLWAIMSFLNPGLLGTASEFERRFATPIERHQDQEAANTLRRLTRPFILRRLKSDPAIARDLPDKLEMKVYCSLTQEQAALYRAVVDDLMQGLDRSEGIQRRGLILAAMTKLKQACNHPAQLLKDDSPLAHRSGKLDRLEAMLDEVLANGEKALIFTQFATLAHRLGECLSERFGRETIVLSGDTPRVERDRLIERFGQAEGPSLFVLSLKAGGTGLNLMAANHAFHYDRWWNPAVEAQATDRAYRIGQTRQVLVRQLICAGTLEERIDQLLESKKDLADRIIGEGEAWLTELSTEQLRALVTLSDDALVENGDG